MKVGIDLDGVIAKESWLQYIGWEINKSFGMKCMRLAKVLYKPFFTDYTIITGRSFELQKMTEDWLYKNCIIYKEIKFNHSFGIIEGIEHKIEKIRELGIELFIESDKAGGRLISMFTGCEVIDVSTALKRGLIK